jgi:hypothetical protein
MPNITREQLSDFVLGGIESGDDATVYAVYLPDDAMADAHAFTVDGDERCRFVRSDLPTPAGQAAWRQDGIAEVGPFRAFAV